MQKVWLKRYEGGVPDQIPSTEQTLLDIIDNACQHFASQTAFSQWLGEHRVSLTFQEVATQSDQFAAYLQQTWQLKPGDSVAIMLPNLIQYPIILFGLIKTGVKVVSINPLYTARELTHQLQDAHAQGIIIFDQALPVYEATGLSLKLMVTTATDMLSGEASDQHAFNHYRSADAQTFNPPAIQSDDVVFLQYTGGTTGLSKGAVLTHKNIVANLLQFDAILSSRLQRGQETIITALPLYHIFALTVNCFCFFHAGARNILVANPRDMAGFVNTLQQQPFSAITGVNTLFNGLLHTPGFADCDFSKLWFSMGGGMPVLRDVAQRWQQTTGCVLLEGYGLSETSPIVTVNPFDLQSFNGSIGLPVPSTDILLQDDQGQPVAVNTAGELCVKGPQVMQGYWNQDNSQVFTQDGYFKTGDMATMDEQGFFYIVDRKKDMILVSGFNVYPNEIEDVLTEHPDIVECAVIGVPDTRTNEAVKAFIVKTSDSNLTDEDIKSYTESRLTPYKQPKLIAFIDEIPKSAVGKILRKDLR